MNTKVKVGIIILGICFVFGFVVFYVSRGNNLNPDALLTQKTLRDAVKEAKQGNRDNITKLISALGNGEKIYISEELLPDYISFLKDSDGQVQWLGSMGLYKIKSPKGTKALFDYLAAKDFVKLSEKAKKKEIESLQYIGQNQASIVAILALGESGDKSAVPLLESLQGIEDLQLEMVDNPVERALAQLGSFKSLFNISPDSDSTEIERASTVVRGIRDINKVPELMATIRDPNIADGIRTAAIDAIAEINPVGAGDFLLKIIENPKNNQRLKKIAAMAAGRTKTPNIEEPLLIYATDPNSEIRPYAFMGLVFGMPEKYIDRWFEKIMDVNEDIEFRKNIANIRFYMPITILKNRREQIFKCLDAHDKNSSPIDEIRVTIWGLINELFGEEPPVILTTRDSQVTASIRSVINLRIMREDYRLRFTEREKKVEEEIERIINIYNDN